MSDEVKVEYMPLDEIVEADVNPKDHDVGQIYQSIKRYGFNQTISINEATGKLLAGHGRLKTLQTMKNAGEKVPNRIKEKDGVWLVPVLRGISFENEMEAQAYLIADNRLTELGGWKSDELSETLQALVVEGFDLDGTGFDLDDLETLITDIDRDRFVVEDIPEADDEEQDVKVQVGRYRFKIEPDYFYEWESRVADELGSRDSEDFVEWLRETLGL